jgi:hypothetical protein
MLSWLLIGAVRKATLVHDVFQDALKIRAVP